jgi:hypothetical protein
VHGIKIVPCTLIKDYIKTKNKRQDDMKEKVVASWKKDGKRDKNEWEWFDAERKRDTKKINRYRNHQNISSFFFAAKKNPFRFLLMVLFILLRYKKWDRERKWMS